MVTGFYFSFFSISKPKSVHLYNLPLETDSLRQITNSLLFKSLKALDTCDEVKLVSLQIFDGSLYSSVPIALIVFFLAVETST